jgi:post-segregation antitoxin (ccd killing protein)
MSRFDHHNAALPDACDTANATVPSPLTDLAAGAETGGEVPAISEKFRQWQRENRAAIECYNEWIAEHGLPLEEFRRF